MWTCCDECQPSDFTSTGVAISLYVEDLAGAAHHAVILESVAKMAYYTIGIAAQADPISRALHDKHFLRKHGHNAYNGQVLKK